MADNQNTNVEYTSNTQKHLKRSLKARHMNMIALGGAIGTGLFVAGGEVRLVLVVLLWRMASSVSWYISS